MTPQYNYRVYYDKTGTIIQYSSTILENSIYESIPITVQQYMASNMRARVHGNKLVLPHEMSTISVLKKNTITGIRTNKYDICVIENEEDNPYWDLEQYDNFT